MIRRSTKLINWKRKGLFENGLFTIQRYQQPSFVILPKVFYSSSSIPHFTKEQLEQARRDRLQSLSPYISKLPEKWIPYAELMRLEKPAGTWLLYIPCTWSIQMAAMETMSPLLSTVGMLCIFGLGSIIMRGAGCTINDLCDKNLDNKVFRSIERPIASGRVSPSKAIAFLGAQTMVGIGILSQLPSECWYLGLAPLPLVFTYPLFKRFTYYPQIALSACFNWGSLLGFPAMGILDWSTMIPLYVSTFLWCMSYDTIYAHQDKKFDVSAGIKSTALKWKSNSKTILKRMFVFQIGTLALAGYNSMLLFGPGFITGLGIFTYRMFKMIRDVDLDSPADCWKWFNQNISTGLYFTCGLFFDYIMKIFGFL